MFGCAGSVADGLFSLVATSGGYSLAVEGGLLPAGFLSLWSMTCRAIGFSVAVACGAQQWWLAALRTQAQQGVVHWLSCPGHVGSSWTGITLASPGIARWALNHGTTREAL